MKMRMTRESVAHFQELLKDHKFSTRSTLEQWFKENMPENWHFGKLTVSDGIGTIEIIDIHDGISCGKLKAQLLPWGTREERTMKAKINNLIIGMQNLEVVYAKDIVSDDNDKLAGRTDYDSETLLIDSTLTESNMRTTFVRSVVNGCARIAGIKMTDAQEKDFSYWLINALVANPQILEMFA